VCGGDCPQLEEKLRLEAAEKAARGGGGGGPTLPRPVEPTCRSVALPACLPACLRAKLPRCRGVRGARLRATHRECCWLAGWLAGCVRCACSVALRAARRRWRTRRQRASGGSSRGCGAPPCLDQWGGDKQEWLAGYFNTTAAGSRE
jgi:hypothetical protein